MMDRARLAARLLATFLDELDEQLRALNADLLALEVAPDDAERLRSVFRVAHTLKGAARAANVPAVEALCHALEGMLAGARDRGAPLTGAQLALLFAGADALADAAQRLRAGGGLQDAPVATLLAQLRNRPAAELRAPSPANPAPPAPPPPAPPPREPADARVETSATAPASAPPPDRVEHAEPVRVGAEKLDTLVAVAGDVAGLAAVAAERAEAAEAFVDRLARAQRVGADDSMRALFGETGALVRAIREGARALARASGELTHGVRELRLRPVSDLTEALPRVVRDIAVSVGKDVGLALEGTDVEADRLVLDGLREPVLHLVRNAIDHGIEPADERARRGKPARATVTVAASLAGDRLRLDVRDDGGGLDTAAIRAAVERRGRVAPSDPRALAAVLFEGGTSTRREATTISGRGVGLDLVRAAAERLGGAVDVIWEEGRGTQFTIETPVTLAALRAVLASAGGQRFAVPTGAVERVLRVDPGDLRPLDGRLVLPGAVAGDDGAPVPVVSLARLLGPPLAERPLEGRVPALLLAGGGQRVAVLVDEVLDEQEVVVRPLERAGPAASARYAGAATLAGAGLVLVLNAAFLLAAASAQGGPSPALGRAAAGRAAAPRRVLVVDDSITTRALEESVLAAAGYDVVTAVDGAEAWRSVQEGGFGLVISDVEMPRMDGLTLCATIRGSERFRDLPVILVTSLDRPEQRERGLEVGADAYITKSSFDQDDLLQTVEQLLGRSA